MVPGGADGLTVRDLRFAYRGGDELFGGLSTHVAPGAVHAVTGESGCGKSTLLYLLGLMLRPSAGSIALRGRVLSGLDDTGRSALRARSFGFVFQDSALDPGRSLLDGVAEPALYAGLTRARARARGARLLELVGLDEHATRRAAHVSGGQAQRAAVARALVNEPAVILADEPTGNLDRRNAEIVLDLLVAAAHPDRTSGAAPVAVIVATHDSRVLERCDEVLRL